MIGSKSSCGRGNTITQVLKDSVAERSGCIQKGDRILSINKLFNLDAMVIRQILGDVGKRAPVTYHQQPSTHWVELEIEFDMSDSVIPSSGVFNVKLAKLNTTGLGITVMTVNGTNHGPYVISEVKPGSPAHRTGSLRSGDILLAVDAHTLQQFNVDALLKENKSEFTTLTVKRNSLPDLMFEAQQRCNVIYNNVQPNSSVEHVYGYKSKYGSNLNKDDSTYKSQSCQPEYIYKMDETRQSTPLGQLRPMLPTESQYTGRNGNENTHSLTTEVNEDQYNEIEQYDNDYSKQYKRCVQHLGSNNNSNILIILSL